MSEHFRISLPDGSVREMPAGSTPADVAAAIGPGLAKAAIAARVDHGSGAELRDLTRPFEGDAALALVTARDEADALELARHDYAHVLAEAVQHAFMSPTLRVYTSDDVVGVELGGVLKNVIALAAGMCDGLNLGDNAKASLITRGLIEMNRYLQTLGAHEDTIYGLSGLGDLVATATSQHSRNRAAGEAIARGENPQQGGKVIEGLRTAGLLEHWATTHGHDLPIVRAVAHVCEGDWTPQQGVAALMGREAKAE